MQELSLMELIRQKQNLGRESISLFWGIYGEIKLDYPFYLFLDRKNDAMYIADKYGNKLIEITQTFKDGVEQVFVHSKGRIETHDNMNTLREHLSDAIVDLYNEEFGRGF